MRTPHFVQAHTSDSTQLAEEAAAGLRARPAALPPKFFYDALGSRLFDAITELEAYYPTRTEAEIFARHGQAMADAVRGRLGPQAPLVDLGAGSCAKAERLFPLLTPHTYVAIDISVDFMRHCLTCLQRAHPALNLIGLGMDFSSGFALPPDLPGLGTEPRLVFYPGSSIGNFQPTEALHLLQDMHAASLGGGLLIGVDLVKASGLLERAYDDELGVTAAFNRNMLLHLNRLLGSDFRVADWRHVALFNEAQSRIEMHLEAQRALSVRWPGGERAFAAGERIHTENSYKWTLDSFEDLLGRAGYRTVTHWTDPQRWFAVFLAWA